MATTDDAVAVLNSGSPRCLFPKPQFSVEHEQEGPMQTLVRQRRWRARESHAPFP